MAFVYCSKCEYYEVDSNGEELCESPKNKVFNRNYYHEWFVYNNKPNYINRDNNCEWFKEFSMDK